MIKIVCFIKRDCDACKIFTKNLMEAINNVCYDIDINIRHSSIIEGDLDLNIDRFPTTIIYDSYCYGNKELAKFIGSYPVSYIESVLFKIGDENDCRRID